MSAAFIIQIAVGLIAAVLGVVLLVRSVRRGAKPGPASYGLRIAGMMLTMFGVVVAGFATIAVNAHII